MQMISFSLQLLSAVTNLDGIYQNESVFFKILSGYLYFSVCKQLVVLIHRFTNQWLFEKRAKRSNDDMPRAASFHQKMKMKKKWSYDKMLID